MCSRFLSVLALAAPLLGAPATIHVCADPNNLPFSDRGEAGFENRLIRLLIQDLGSDLEFVWSSPRKGVLRHTLDEGLCDVVMGVPTAVDSTPLTLPYYSSAYVFVSRKDRNLHVTSLKDPRLKQWRIGMHRVGEDYAPPAIALARLGVTGNITGFSLFGAYGEASPAAQPVQAVAGGTLDLAIVWGPFAGYFAARQATALEVTPVSPTSYLGVPFVYQIAMAVRPGDYALRDALNEALQKHCPETQALLREFGVPQSSGGEGKSACDALLHSPAASWR